jgi:hypothetical protein
MMYRITKRLSTMVLGMCQNSMMSGKDIRPTHLQENSYPIIWTWSREHPW